ncbi:MAG: sensor histidine kinase [Streptosporangiaceae bacterium]
MADSRASAAKAGPALAANRVHHGRSAADLLEYAVAQLLRDDTDLAALPAVLERLVATFGIRAALAFQPSAGQPATVLEAYPARAADPALLARIGALSLAQRDRATLRGGHVDLSGEDSPDGRPASLLLIYSVPVGGQCLCALALIGETASWNEEVRSTAYAVAAIVASQIRHANDLATRPDRQALAEIERSHAALADQTERLNCLIASAIPGILITDERGLITHVSQSFGALYGIDSPERLAGTRAALVVGRVQEVFADPDAFAQRSAEVLRAREPVSGEQFGCADGRTIECDYWPVLVDDQWRGDLWLSWDMSDRTELERQRQRMLDDELENNARLRKVDDARNQFLAIVSHELRTPLTSIVSFCELIRGEAEGLTSEGMRFLDIIERNADRLHRLIGDLLMLDRVEAGALPLDLAEVSIPELTAEAVKSASAGAAKQGVTIVVRTGDGPPVQADARRLTQVLDNLLSNAVKFSHRNGVVRVTASCEGRTWRIDVADSGIGIPPAEADQLFNRFVRASNARTAGLPGIGLGLSIVKILAEMHGGRVEVHSVLGLGSTFSVYLPAAP